jgi:serine/threonine-protein kinase RsbW
MGSIGAAVTRREQAVPTAETGGVGGMRPANHMPRRSAADDMAALARNAVGPVLNGGVVVCSRGFPATSDQVARMRQVLRETVAYHLEFATIALLASELATNSIRHSGSRFFVLCIARIRRDGVRVAIIDEARKGFPYLGNQSVDAEQGRGLKIVDAMARRWGVTRIPAGGGAVWFECFP